MAREQAMDQRIESLLDDPRLVPIKRREGAEDHKPCCLRDAIPFALCKHECLRGDAKPPSSRHAGAGHGPSGEFGN